MTNKLVALIISCAFGIGPPAAANVVTEPTFDQKMSESTLVVVGTATDIYRGRRRGFGSTATLSVLTRLKGTGADVITVSTHSAIEELNPRCCEVGATYMMFLRPSVSDGRLFSVFGHYGMIRIGGPPGRDVSLSRR